MAVKATIQVEYNHIIEVLARHYASYFTNFNLSCLLLSSKLMVQHQVFTIEIIKNYFFSLKFELKKTCY